MNMEQNNIGIVYLLTNECIAILNQSNGKCVHFSDSPLVDEFIKSGVLYYQ